MNVLYCGDKGIFRGVLVSILSLLMRGDKDNIYNIYIMTIKYQNVHPFEKSQSQFLDKLVKKTNPKNSVQLIDATAVFVKNLPEKNMGSYFTPCSMLRLYIDKISELNKLERILYLDYDVVCRKDIKGFYNTKLDNTEVAGVLDIYGKNFYHYHGLLNFDYMNSGVLLFNVPECLKTGMFEKAVEFCRKRRMMLADQAALNKSITKRKLMPRKYNEQAERPKADTVLHHFSNNFKFWPVFHVQKVKPFEINKVHEILQIHEYDDIFEEYNKIINKIS